MPTLKISPNYPTARCLWINNNVGYPFLDTLFYYKIMKSEKQKLYCYTLLKF